MPRLSSWWPIRKLNSSELTPPPWRWVRLCVLAACALAGAAVAGINEWTYVGLAPEEITSIAVDPTNPDIIYASAIDVFWDPTREGGLFKTTDHGVTWDTLGFRHSDVHQVVIDLSDSQVVWAVCGVLGLWISTDGGQHWSSRSAGLYLGGADDSAVRILAVAHDSSGVAVCGTRDEMGPGRCYRSSNGGESWSQIDAIGGAYPDAVIFGGQLDGHLYVMSATSHSLWRSQDNGLNFVELALSPWYGLYDLRMAPASPSGLWWATQTGGILESRDAGEHWIPRIARFQWPDTVIWHLDLVGGGDTALYVSNFQPFLTLDAGAEIADLRHNLPLGEPIDLGWIIHYTSELEIWIYRRSGGLWSCTVADTGQAARDSTSGRLGPQKGFITVSPNPNLGVFSIKVSDRFDTRSWRVVVYDITGRQVEQCFVKLHDGSAAISLSTGLPCGPYFILGCPLVGSDTQYSVSAGPFIILR
jgi:photosystem II stability/assembly factor-like uncharacterized protein